MRELIFDIKTQLMILSEVPKMHDCNESWNTQY